MTACTACAFTGKSKGDKGMRTVRDNLLKNEKRYLAFFICLLLAVFTAAGAACAVPEEASSSVYDVSPVLCNPSPSEEAQALMNWMCDLYGEKIISGQYLHEYEYGAELEAVASATGGLYPAMVGMDLLNYSPSSVSLGSWPTSVDQAIQYWKKGYIVTFCWHWVAPEPYLDTTGNQWWGGFYTDHTTFDLGKAMSGEDPEGYDLLIRDMDAIAKQLLRLRDAGVPVLWRPLHEASGGWFWWGASGAEPYLALYRMMYDRFTNLYGLNNLIWVWNGQNAAWYPGDDVVDIIGEDIYPGKHQYASQKASFDKCRSYTDEKKLIMLSECGCVPSPAACLKDDAMWSAFGVWCYEFVLDGNKHYSSEYTDAEMIQKFYTHELTVTLKDVPDFGRSARAGEGKTDEIPEDNLWHFTDGTLSGNARQAGDAVQLWGNEAGDAVSLKVRVAESGSYQLIIRQSGIGGGKENYLKIDGETVGNTIVAGEEEEDCAFGPVFLEAGEHEITVSAFWGWVNLKTLQLIPAEEEEGK